MIPLDRGLSRKATAFATSSVLTASCLSVAFSANGNFEGGGFENPQGSQQDPGIGSRKLAPLERVDLRAEVNSGPVRVSAFVQNVFDSTVVLTSIQGNEYYTNPRIFGLEIGYRF